MPARQRARLRIEPEPEVVRNRRGEQQPESDNHGGGEPNASAAKVDEGRSGEPHGIEGGYRRQRAAEPSRNERDGDEGDVDTLVPCLR